MNKENVFNKKIFLLGRGGVVREITLLSRNSEENEEDEEEFR
jgi:hypothetical protein